MNRSSEWLFLFAMFVASCGGAVLTTTFVEAQWRDAEIIRYVDFYKTTNRKLVEIEEDQFAILYNLNTVQQQVDFHQKALERRSEW